MPIDAPALIREQSVRALAAMAADPDGAVSWCGDWKVRDVVAHIGGGHEMAARIVDGRPTADLAVRGEFQVPEGDDEEVAAWVRVASAHLLDALDGVEPAAECWTWWPDDPTVGFWARRMAHETLIHRWDAERGAGLVPEPMAPSDAADGIDEMLDRFVGLTRILFSAPGAGESAHLHCSDTDGEWLITFLPEGRHELTREHAKGDVAFRGPAEDLLLFLWGRDQDGVETLGDDAVAARWRELVPPM